MKMDLNKVSYDGQWFDFGDFRTKIRPYPDSRMDVMFNDGNRVFSGEATFDRFSYCLEAWEGVVDANGQPLKLTSEVKKTIYDFNLGVVDGVSLPVFVLRTAGNMASAIENDTKN